MRKKSSLQLRIEPELEAKFVSTCKALNLSVSEVVRTLIADYCLSTPVSTELSPALIPDFERYPDLKKLRLAKKIEISIGEMYCGPGGIAIAANNSKVQKK